MGTAGPRGCSHRLQLVRDGSFGRACVCSAKTLGTICAVLCLWSAPASLFVVLEVFSDWKSSENDWGGKALAKFIQFFFMVFIVDFGSLSRCIFSNAQSIQSKEPPNIKEGGQNSEAPLPLRSCFVEPTNHLLVFADSGVKK